MTCSSFSRIALAFQAGKLTDDDFHRELFGAYHPRLHHFSLALGARDPEAKDALVPDVLNSFHLRVRSKEFLVTGDAAITKYLYIRTRGAVQSMWRASLRRREQGLDDFDPEDDQFSNAVWADELRRVLEVLPYDQRRLIELRYHYGLKLREIAALDACGVSTVDGRLKKALGALREQMTGG
jgi:RNA polymerase sigma factor (sigma-70 family)